MTELREKTASVLRATQRADVVITVRGKPKVMLQRITSDEVEGLQLLESPKVRRLLNRALRDVKAGRTVPFEQLPNRHAGREQRIFLRALSIEEYEPSVYAGLSLGSRCDQAFLFLTRGKGEHDAGMRLFCVPAQTPETEVGYSHSAL